MDDDVKLFATAPVVICLVVPCLDLVVSWPVVDISFAAVLLMLSFEVIELLTRLPSVVVDEPLVVNFVLCTLFLLATVV